MSPIHSEIDPISSVETPLAPSKRDHVLFNTANMALNRREMVALVSFGMLAMESEMAETIHHQSTQSFTAYNIL